jgi:hypothetical protein
MVPAYQLKPGWRDVAIATLEQVGAPLQLDGVLEKAGGERELERTMPDFSDAKAYAAYTVLSRISRLADWIASGGGEHAIYRFEERA